MWTGENFTVTQNASIVMFPVLAGAKNEIRPECYTKYLFRSVYCRAAAKTSFFVISVDTQMGARGCVRRPRSRKELEVVTSCLSSDRVPIVRPNPVGCGVHARLE
jgi:hypothetical protein